MQSYKPENPVIVQSDKSVLLEVDSPLYTEARDTRAGRPRHARARAEGAEDGR